MRAGSHVSTLTSLQSTRVKLTPLPGVVGSDYINASFIDGYTKRNSYIATQGPLEDTIADFWRAIWENEVDVIVMLTDLIENGRAKSDQYWPDKDEGSTVMGDFQITLTAEEPQVYGYVRELSVSNLVSDETRVLKQFQYIVWPESGAQPLPGTLPELLAGISEFQSTKIVLSAESDIYGNAEAINAQSISTQTKPVLVHDAAGVGRTGAFLAAHIALERYRIEAKVDLFTIIRHMRTQRMSMVQTHDQLEWAYRVILEAIEKPAGLALYENVGPAHTAAHSRPPQELPPLPPKQSPSGATAETSFIGGPESPNSGGYLKIEEEGEHRDDFSEPPDVEDRVNHTTTPDDEPLPDMVPESSVVGETYMV